MPTTYSRTFIHLFEDIFESLGETLNVAKPTKGSFAKPTKGSSVAKFLTEVVGCRRSKNCIGVDLNASIFEQGSDAQHSDHVEIDSRSILSNTGVRSSTFKSLGDQLPICIQQYQWKKS